MSTQPNSTPTVQGKTKYLYVFCTFKKIMSELTCNAQDVHGAVVVCRKQKMDQKKQKKTEKVPKPPAHLPHAIYHMLCWPNFKLSATCMYEGCVCQPEHIDFNCSRPSFSPSLPLPLSSSLSFSHSLTHSLFLTLQNKKIKGQIEVTVLVLYRTVPSIPDLPYPPVPR